MTDIEINTTIAEALGRKYHRPTEEEFRSGSYYQYEPNFCDSLDLMHEAEAWLKANDKPTDRNHGGLIHAYQIAHFDILGQGHAPTYFCLLHATARQRAEAFLRTIGKWH